ncbi:circadian locomoter output cycles protein kaput-like isoform X4 [Frankliniella occidentalis]|uniref:Circadian locomoter output cycles protein kaput-like isoform X4 n=1 Tax=Frankliniella occidentalis TaxID=133901 RepID=A0A9C6TT99_FRAOC|nr:circadian locomoter output cycles protein kaput-like isoform X4 [Frankliniella occidentalis]
MYCYMNALRQSRGDGDASVDHNGSQDDNETLPLDSDHKLQTVAASSPWSSKSSVGKASRLALTNVSSPAPSGSIVSTGARGRGQMSFHGTGPDSDSNSMSTDSVTSRQSHLRTSSHGPSTMRAQSNQRYHSVPQPSTSSGIQQSVEPPTKLMCTQMPAAPNVAIQAMPGIQAVANLPSAEPPAPHPQQFMAAIPVQPVIAGGFTAPTATVSTSAEVNLLPQPVMMSPAQTQYQEQLQRKHEELQQMILQQQQELRLVSDQLLMARYGIVPASLLNVSLPYTVASNAVGSTVTHQALAPTSLPIPVPASSELFVTPHHHSLVHSPLAVAPPVVVDPQQMNLQAGTEDMVPFQLSQQQAQLLLNFNPNASTQHRQ